MPEALRRLFAITGPLPNFPARDAIYPKQEVPVVRGTREGGREMVLMRWSLLPAWVQDPAKWRYATFNAKAETLLEKASFRGPFERRRCLIPADGFYEFSGQPGSKQRFLFRMRDGAPFALAGLWDRWRAPSGGEVIDSCTIIVTEPNAIVAPVHDRMPVIVEPGDYGRWLDAQHVPPQGVRDLLRPYPADGMTVQPA